MCASCWGRRPYPELKGQLGEPRRQGGFDAYRKACGVKYFSAREACTPRWKAKAKSVGYERFVPPQFVWPWCGLVLKLCDGMRRAIGEPIKLRNLWRPQSYNRLVSTSKITSDHPNGCGADLYFSGVGSRRKAEGFCGVCMRWRRSWR